MGKAPKWRGIQGRAGSGLRGLGRPDCRGGVRKRLRFVRWLLNTTVITAAEMRMSPQLN